jgi:transcriptional regulator with XRE-family HTH domain
MTQVEVSLKLGKPQSYVSKYETGERKLDYVEVTEICVLFGVSIYQFDQAYRRILPSM